MRKGAEEKRKGGGGGGAHTSSSANNSKITRFFSATGIVRSTSRVSSSSSSSFSALQVMTDNPPPSVAATTAAQASSVTSYVSKVIPEIPQDEEEEDIDEVFCQSQTPKVPSLIGFKPPVLQSEFSEKSLIVITDDDKTDTELSESEDKPQSPKRKTFLQKYSATFYLLPHEDKHWGRREAILIELKEKKVMNTTIFFDRMSSLLRLASSSSQPAEQNIESLKQFVFKKEVEERRYFITTLLPFIASLALKVVDISAIKILAGGNCDSVTLSKLEVASLLANMFFVTLVTQTHVKNIPYGNSFKALYAGSLDYNGNGQKIEKLKCICHYFHRIAQLFEKSPDQLHSQKITFERLAYNPVRHDRANVSVFWKQNTKPLVDVEHSPTASIEHYKNAIHVDFANEFIGGGVLDHGLVQEEIRFLVSPELIVSRVFSPKLEDHEAIMIAGSEQFCKYEGYGYTFKFDGNLDESNIPLDALQRKKTAVLAIDAINFRQSYNPDVQFKIQTIMREILKAYVGFEGGCGLAEMEKGERFAIATGRWGCGIFKGDPQLKFLIQWIVASQAERKMIFCSFQDKELKEINEIVDLMKKKRKFTIGEAFVLLHKYTEFFNKQGIKSTLFQFIKIALSRIEDD